jgi:SAM-dependent methyltransferase
MTGWDHPDTPRQYEAFCRKHARYARANVALVAHASIGPADRVLDFAAGTGRTAEAVLRKLGPLGRVVCIEPSEPMRAEGISRLADSRIEWHSTLEEITGAFDRILCGAAVWQMDPLAQTFAHLSGLLVNGGALCFNIPALYLLEPDEPGGGSDPLLLTLPTFLSQPCNGSAPCERKDWPDAAKITEWLGALGLRSESWTFRVRFTQDAYGSWLAIPAVSGMETRSRIAAALEKVDRSSWKWERWRGWTAWKS